MYRENKHPVRDIVAMGTGVFTALFLLAFYPATVMMAYFGSTTEPGGMQRGFFAFAITWIIIAVLTVFANNPGASGGSRALCWILLIGLYLFCLPGLFHINSWINNPTYPKYGTSDVTDYSSDPLPIDMKLVPYDGFWKDIFTWDSKRVWDGLKGPVLTVLVLLPFVMISKFFRKNKE